ncbi:MAG: molybdate ABC transporter permease subunit [Microthrixaceae bacterium]|nr:molybdate ABC transporter permease subunit [Microthrixaceae bacterium]
MSRVRRRPPAPVVAAAGVTILFFAIPLVGILQRANWSTVWSDLTTSGARDALRLSLISSVLAAGLSIAFGTPLAWVLARSAVPAKPLLRGLVLLPMVLPPVVGGVALLAAFSLRSPIGGWLHDAFGLQLTFATSGAVMAETFVAMPFYVITVEGAMRGMDQRYEDAAASLGARRLTVFRRVTLPTIAPSVVAGGMLAWARALGEFGATITFAGNVMGRTRTLPLAVYLELESNQDAAVALSLVLLAVSLLVLVSLRGRWLSSS